MFYIFVALSIFVQSKDTNDEVRICMKEAVASTKKCQNQYTKCFDDNDCNNQFDDLFRDCIIGAGTTIYESSCVNSGFIQITNALLADLFDCMVRQCNVMQGKLVTPKSNLTISECFSSVLLDSSKCWLKSKDCQSNCQESLQKLQECDSFISKNDAANTRKCLDQKTHSDAKAKEVQLCLYQQCL